MPTWPTRRVLGGVSDIIADPSNLEAARQLPLRVLVLGGGENRDLHLPDDADVVDMEQIDPDVVALPGWYRPNPGFAKDLAYIAFATVGGKLVAAPDHQLPVGAVGVRHRVGGQPGPQRHRLLPDPAAPPVRTAGEPRRRRRRRHPHRAVARPAARPVRPRVRQYGVTVVSYTWAMLREVIDDPSFVLNGNHPVRLFIGSGMPTGLWKRVEEEFEPAHIVEFFATTDGQAVLANVSGAKLGSEGRPLPGGGHVELAAYDVEDDLILEDERGFVRLAAPNEVGVLLAHPRGPIDPTASVKRGVFAPADTWVSTEYLFRRDEDGDFWLVDNRGSVIRTERGPVFSAAVNDAVGRVTARSTAPTRPTASLTAALNTGPRSVRMTEPRVSTSQKSPSSSRRNRYSVDTQVSAGANTPRLTEAVGSMGPRGWAKSTPTSLGAASRTKPRSSSRMRSSSTS